MNYTQIITSAKVNELRDNNKQLIFLTIDEARKEREKRKFDRLKFQRSSPYKSPKSKQIISNPSILDNDGLIDTILSSSVLPRSCKIITESH